MKKVIAICGKGGVGKTTIAAMFARELLNRKSLRALIVDADPTGGLGMALGIPSRRSLDDVKAEIIQSVKGSVDRKDIAASIDYLIFGALAERENLAFLSIGRPEEIGCYCSINSLLRDSIELLAEEFDITLIDAEAGIEQVNRNVMSGVNYILLVSDMTAKGIRTAGTIAGVARKISGLEKTGLLLNRARSESNVRDICSRYTIDIIGWIPEDETVGRFDEEGISFFDLPRCPAYEAAAAIFDEITG